jgi:hypothetical protein
MHEHLQSLLRAGWEFTLCGENRQCRATGKKSSLAAHDGYHACGLSVHPIEALAQAMESAQIIEDSLKA